MFWSLLIHPLFKFFVARVAIEESLCCAQNFTQRNKIDLDRKSKTRLLGSTQHLRHYTKQHLKKRFTQHKHGSATHSALSKHLQESNHNINFDDVKILCTENNEKIRDVMEMIYIRSHNCLNLQTDTATLSKCYNHLIQCFP